MLYASCVHTEKNFLPKSFYQVPSSISKQKNEDLEYCKVQNTTETTWQQWHDALTTVFCKVCSSVLLFLAFLYGVCELISILMDGLYLLIRAIFLLFVWFCCICLECLFDLQSVIGGVQWHGDQNSCYESLFTHAVTVWFQYNYRNWETISFYFSLFRDIDNILMCVARIYW